MKKLKNFDDIIEKSIEQLICRKSNCTNDLHLIQTLIIINLRNRVQKEIRKYWKLYKKFYDKSMKTNNFHSYPNAGEAMAVMDFIQIFFDDILLKYDMDFDAFKKLRKIK